MAVMDRLPVKRPWRSFHPPDPLHHPPRRGKPENWRPRLSFEYVPIMGATSHLPTAGTAVFHSAIRAEGELIGEVNLEVGGAVNRAAGG